MSTELARVEDESRSITAPDREQAAAALAHVLATGDLSKLTNEHRVAYYLHQCETLGISSVSRPFDWIWFKEPSGTEKLTLYPNQSAAAQLRRNHQISVRITRREIVGELFVCEAEGMTPNGRIGQASKYVPLTNKNGKLTGTLLANAFMRAETGCLRRLTLSMVGLSLPPDIDELHTARPAIVDGTGRIIERPTEEQKALAANPAMANVLGVPTYETTGSADASPLAGTPDQRVRADELQQPQRPAGPPPTFRASDTEVKRWLGAWFGAVKGTSLDDDDARHRFVRSYSDGRTESLRAFLSSCTERQAGDFLAHVRALAEAERTGQGDDEYPNLTAQMAKDPDVADTRPAGMTPEGHAAAVLTGAPAPPAPTREEGNNWPGRINPELVYSRAELIELYDAWGAKMRSLDTMWRPNNVKSFGVDRLMREVGDLSAQVADLEDHLSRFGSDEEDPAEDDQGETAF